MNFDPYNVPLVPNNWFSSNAVYEGRARAEFEEPKGAADGPAVVRFDVYGEASVEMSIEEYSSEQPLQFGLMEFLSGEKPAKVDGGVMLAGSFKTNPCTKLTVTTPDGVFSSTDISHYDRSINIVGGEPANLDFHLVRSQFDANNEEPARYWVLPLANFISDFRQHHLDLDRHPLRIYPTPVVPAGLAEKEAFAAAHNANLKNRLIGFEYKGGLGFIERLDNYDARKDDLIEGRERYAVTAVMVGEIGPNSLALTDLDSWLPSHFLRLLGLATGSKVSVPWIELRDGRAGLVRRLHVTWEGSSYYKGRRTIQEGIHTGVGYLLTRYQSSPDCGEPYLRVALKHLIQAGLGGGSIEDRFIYLCRALDGLCEHYGLKQQNLMQGLDAAHQGAVKQALRDAADKIRTCAGTAAAAGRHDQSRTLSRIAERTLQTPANIDRNFGLAVVDLLKRFNLPDADIIDAHYQQNPRADGIENWAGALAHYRGTPTHRGYFNFSGKEHDVHDILIIKDHLHDILLRILFKIIGYDGTYQPPVIKWTIDNATTDWVKPDTPASRLGYK